MLGWVMVCLTVSARQTLLIVPGVGEHQQFIFHSKQFIFFFSSRIQVDRGIKREEKRENTLKYKKMRNIFKHKCMKLVCIFFFRIFLNMRKENQMIK